MASAAEEKPSVLIIGGLGYIGRFLALHIHEQQLASEVRLVDKVLPQLAWLAPEFAEACAPSKFVQADASREQSLPKIFDRPNGGRWDYIFNCGGETRYSQEDEVYRARSLALSRTVGREAARRGCRAFVELSTGMVYRPDAAPSREGDRLKPWSRIAVFKLQAEEELAGIAGLPLCVARLAHVYGPYASQFISTALCMARVYQETGEEMKWLWTKDLRVNTVHIDDCVAALWAIAAWADRTSRSAATGAATTASSPHPIIPWDAKAEGTPIPTFNLVDAGATTQGTLATLLGAHFGIATGFQGALVSTFARLHLDRVVDDVNETLLGPWAELLAAAGVARPGPISPFLERELLKDTDLSMDGAKIARVTGYRVRHERITAEDVAAVVESYRRIGWWPEVKEVKGVKEAKEES